MFVCPVGTSMSLCGNGFPAVSSEQKLAEFMKICGVKSLIDPEEAKKYTTYEGNKKTNRRTDKKQA